MTNRYLCIHGHFYQPPRENPWVDLIEYQSSAAPYHDWNERITRECYGPNTCARINDENGKILKFINNYEYLSFNFGPTLLSWLERYNSAVYDKILAADLASKKRYQGHGNAMAQVYNHIIMPLASRRDKLTQIRWGLADFKYRFNRPAEGMWLAETAVDLRTLDLMAREGVKFTILSPTQAKAVRPLKEGDQDQTSWIDVTGSRIDPSRPYRVILDHTGRLFIDIFFYDGPLSQAIAYEKLLQSGENFLNRIKKVYKKNSKKPQLANLATDGESYGHHFKFGDMTLAWLFQHLDKTQAMHLINYGLFLEKYHPQHEVKIFDNSAWSCAHGVDRWRTDCGCNVGQGEGWNQAWRKPLRQGLDWLSLKLADFFNKRGKQLLKNPWLARDRYIQVILDPSDKNKANFLNEHSLHTLDQRERMEALSLLESQRMAMYMFTSCGWFFDDISGLEATQVLKYAYRAIELVSPWSDQDFELEFITYLDKAQSNIPEKGKGSQIFKEQVKPARFGPSRIAAQQALTSSIKRFREKDCPVTHLVKEIRQQPLNMAGKSVVIGEVKTIDTNTDRESSRSYLILNQDDINTICLVGKNPADQKFDDLVSKIEQQTKPECRENPYEIFSGLFSHVKEFGIKHLFIDTQKCLIQEQNHQIKQALVKTLRGSLDEIKKSIYLLNQIGELIPEDMESMIRLLFFDDIRLLISQQNEKMTLDWKELVGLPLISQENRFKISDPFLEQDVKSFLQYQIKSMAKSFKSCQIKKILTFLNIILWLRIDIWEHQNAYYNLFTDTAFIQRLDREAKITFFALGSKLGFSDKGA